MRTLLTLGLLLIAPRGWALDTEVIVYGATPGGYCAAIAAAREGSRVLLLEPSSHVGGVNTGGLSFSDSNQTVRSTLRGLFEEWHTRIAMDYTQRGISLPYDVAVKDQAVWTYEPHVAARVTSAMLKEAGVLVLTQQPLTHVTMQDNKIVSVTTPGGLHRAKVFVDATYEGDLLARAGVRSRLGREGRAEFAESLAGRQYPKTKLAIKGFDDAGQTLPFITSEQRGDDQAGDRNIMVYSFRLCLTKDPANRIPFPAPTAYDPKRFELIRRYFQRYPEAPVPWDLYPLPGGKFDANNGIGKFFSMGLVGASVPWCEASAADRARLWEAHRQYTLEFYHFLTTDMAVSPKVRRAMAELGLCRDEFPATDHWSPQLYVREGRRLQGRYMLSQKDILNEPAKPDAIAVSSFPIDSHDCQRLALGESVLNEGTIMPLRVPGQRHGYAYHIPYRAITPVAEECTNLLVPVALAATHVAYCSVRVEPTWMTIGQSAGIAAALAAKEGVTVQALAYPSLRARLLAQKVVLTLPTLAPLGNQPTEPPAPPRTTPLEGLVLDDTQATLSGHWVRSALFNPHYGAGYLHDDNLADGQSSAKFNFKAPTDGEYALRMAYSAHPSRTKSLPLVVSEGKTAQVIMVDQTIAVSGNDLFRTVGTISLRRGRDYVLTVTNKDTAGFVILDAFQIRPLVAPDKETGR